MPSRSSGPGGPLLRKRLRRAVAVPVDLMRPSDAGAVHEPDDEPPGGWALQHHRIGLPERQHRHCLLPAEGLASRFDLGDGVAGLHRVQRVVHHEAHGGVVHLNLGDAGRAVEHDAVVHKGLLDAHLEFHPPLRRHPHDVVLRPVPERPDDVPRRQVEAAAAVVPVQPRAARGVGGPHPRDAGGAVPFVHLDPEQAAVVPTVALVQVVEDVERGVGHRVQPVGVLEQLWYLPPGLVVHPQRRVPAHGPQEGPGGHVQLEEGVQRAGVPVQHVLPGVVDDGVHVRKVRVATVAKAEGGPEGDVLAK
mmetsp:Transcript_2870/g.4538  ORF Transcript_2870/g.4538 Transcript_2870/m.4538 type:complete len:305 (-) Transcript_2870:257-1171(-)